MSNGSSGAMWKSFARDREVTSTCKTWGRSRSRPKGGVAAMGPFLSKKHRKRVNDGADANAPPKIPTRNVATMEVPHTHSTESAGLGKSTSSTSMVGSPEDHIVSSGYFSELCHIPNADFLSQYNKNLAQQVAIGSQLRLHFKQEVRLLKKARAQVASDDLRDALSVLYLTFAHLRVEKRCTEIDARRDALSIDFDKELYPHMVTVIVFANSYPRGLPKLEALKDASMEVIMTSLHLKSDFKEDAPKWIRDICPSTSQLKIPLCLEVRDPRDPRAIKEEMLLKNAIAANVSSAEKKKKCRVVCRTHGVGFAHHARSNGIPVSAPLKDTRSVAAGVATLLCGRPIITRLRRSSSKSKFSRNSSSLCMASTAGCEDMGKSFNPILVSLAQASLDFFTQASVCSFYESIGLQSLLASFLSPGRVPSFKYSIIGVIHVGLSSSTTVVTSFSCMDFSLSIYTKTYLEKYANLVDEILLRASTFLFLLHGTWFIEKLVKPLTRILTFSRYLIIFSSFATYAPKTWFDTNLESTLMYTLRTPICAAIRRPAISASYSASLLEAVN
nr:hypothetical protein [Tanacetum cinerariifolium]